jgi:hypothetical protein
MFCAMAACAQWVVNECVRCSFVLGRLKVAALEGCTSRPVQQTWILSSGVQHLSAIFVHVHVNRTACVKCFVGSIPVEKSGCHCAVLQNDGSCMGAIPPTKLWYAKV